MACSITIEKVDAAFGAVRVLEEVSVDAKPGETVVLLGTNGNGKSTLMKCIMGIVRPRAGRITADIDGVRHDLTSLTTEQIVDLGIALVPEGRRLFPKLTVEENLALGAFRPTARAQIRQNLDACFETFPRLAERRKQIAAHLSGGEQQMLAIGRALMAHPRVLLMDEPSEGLAPQIVSDVMATIRRLKESGLSIVLVEQNPTLVFDVADDVVVLNSGRVVVVSTGAELKRDSASLSQHLGVF